VEILKFIEESCERCGKCLSLCPYLEISEEKAKEEIKNMINAGIISEVLGNCLGCAYCDAICPTQSNPRELIRDINAKRIIEEGLPSFFMISDEIPFNSATVALDIEPEIKKENIKKFLKPPRSDNMFYLGCGLSYVQTDLPNTKLLEDFPKIGGDKFCCGGYVKMFGEEETKIKGKSLMQEFKELGIKKFVIFCPGCMRMMKGVYSNLLPEFQDSFKFQTFSSYLIEKYHQGDLNIINKIKERITFHDPCAWRNLDSEIFESPRELLEILGAEVVDMKHNRKKTLCCGSPASEISEEFFKSVSSMRITEVQEIDAEKIAVSCTGCLALGKPSREIGIETFHMIELAQIAIGEKPLHRTIEIKQKYNNLVEKTITENPNLLKEKSKIKNGKIVHI
jgi:Fe-S oxidoreductase